MFEYNIGMRTLRLMVFGLCLLVPVLLSSCASENHVVKTPVPSQPQR